MEKYVQQIYCDESGATGNDLIHPDQPMFSYASIAISHEEAKDCVDRIIRDFKVQGGELKSKNLLKNSRGLKAVTSVLEQQHERMLVSIFDKKYCLACKLFEYIFEPPLAKVNSIFYGIGFHEFVACVLYLHFRAGARFAEKIFEDFQRMMRELSDASVTHLFGAVRLPKSDFILDLIRQFCFHNRGAILEELDTLRGGGVGRWVLDLTDTALFMHLAEWGSRYYQLDVYCDKTDKLEGFWDLMSVMIGREEKAYNAFKDREQPITFNLRKEISVVESREYPGVQLADIAAGATVYALQNLDSPESMKWREYIDKMLHWAVVPDRVHIEMDKISSQRNLILLEELVRRSERGLPLTEGIGEFLAHTTNYLAGRGSLR